MVLYSPFTRKTMRVILTHTYKNYEPLWDDDQQLDLITTGGFLLSVIVCIVVYLTFVLHLFL